MKIVVGVSHCAWIPERAVLIDKMRTSHVAWLCQASWRPLDIGVFVQADAAPSPAWDWSGRLWAMLLGHAAVRRADHCVVLQDACSLAPCFWDAIGALLTAVPDELVGLHVVHPGARDAAADGERLVTTTNLIARGYAMPTPMLQAFLTARGALPEEELRASTEDTLLEQWLVQQRRRVWHPVPTILRNAAVESTGGRDGEFYRDTAVGWEGYETKDLTDPLWWRATRMPPRHLVYGGDCYPGVLRSTQIGFDGRKVSA